MKVHERHAMEYRPRKIRLPKDVEPEFIDKYCVREYHIDGNKHMNNAWYVAIGEEYLPREWEFSRVRIEYLLQARVDEVMRIERYAIDSSYIIVMRRDDGKIYSLVEFS
jgi:acyl-ACP thioesterase